jgi:transcription antitermination factor NusG
MFTMRPVNHSNDKHWFALYTKPRCEFKARNQLNSIKTDYYLPTIKKYHQWSDRKKEIEEPLIRGYIFIYADEHERILSLEQSSIIRCVCQGGRAACIPDWQIENLKKIENVRTDLVIYNGIIPGEKVEITSGPLKGVIGTLENIGCKNRLFVSIDLLNRSIIVQLANDSILKIN